MKAFILCLLLSMICFSAFAQPFTSLNEAGLLMVYQDLNEAANQFEGNNKIRSIVIANSVKTIPEGAFKRTGVRDITFQPPSSLTVIPFEAFWGNYYVTRVFLPESVTTIEAAAFASCSGLQQIRLSHGLKAINEGAFEDTRITRLYIPDSVGYIGAGILDHTDTIQSLRLPADADVARDNLFYNAYIRNEKKAGIYTRSGTDKQQWIYSPDKPEDEYYR